MQTLRATAASAAAAVAALLSLALQPAWASLGDATTAAPATLTAEQIADRCVEVRGGLAAWRKITSVIWDGHLESEHSQVPKLAFRLEEKQPGKSRFEINEPSQRSLRVFNGVAGWKVKRGQDGRPEVTSYSAEEVRFARATPGLEGPLIDFRSKGSTVELENTETIDGRTTYRIGVRLKNGERQTVWIDAANFLETRYDRPAYGATGKRGTVTLRFLEYKEVEGLALPSLIEIDRGGGGKPDRMVIERVALNADIDDREFNGPGAPRGRTSIEPGKANP